MQTFASESRHDTLSHARRPWLLMLASIIWAVCVFVGGAATLIDENGARVLLVLAVPLVLTLLVCLALGREGARGTRRRRRTAWTLIGVLACFGVVTGFSIGLFVLPIAAMLAGAASLTRERT
jgi:Mn2+/Fe2+ NRAMP family transporter